MVLPREALYHIVAYLDTEDSGVLQRGSLKRVLADIASSDC